MVSFTCPVRLFLTPRAPCAPGCSWPRRNSCVDARSSTLSCGNKRMCVAARTRACLPRLPHLRFHNRVHLPPFGDDVQMPPPLLLRPESAHYAVSCCFLRVHGGREPGARLSDGGTVHVSGGMFASCPGVSVCAGAPHTHTHAAGRVFSFEAVGGVRMFGVEVTLICSAHWFPPADPLAHALAASHPRAPVFP